MLTHTNYYRTFNEMSEDNKMRIISKWWKSWQNYMQKEDDNLIKNSTLIDMKKRTKQNLTEKKDATIVR